MGRKAVDRAAAWPFAPAGGNRPVTEAGRTGPSAQGLRIGAALPAAAALPLPAAAAFFSLAT